MTDHDIQSLRTSVSILFYGSIDHDVGSEIDTIGKYFGLLAENIDHRRGTFNADMEFVGEFEAVCLVLKDRLALYPDPVKQQVINILDDKQLTEFFSALGTLGKQDFERLTKQKAVADLGGMVSGILGINLSFLRREFGFDKAEGIRG